MYISLCLHICLFLSLSFIFMYICEFLHISICFYFSISLCLCVCLCVSLSLFLSLFVSMFFFLFSQFCLTRDLFPRNTRIKVVHPFSVQNRAYPPKPGKVNRKCDNVIRRNHPSEDSGRVRRRCTCAIGTGAQDSDVRSQQRVRCGGTSEGSTRRKLQLPRPQGRI